MKWQKEFGAQHLKNFDYILGAIIIFFLIGIIFNNQIAFIGLGVFAAYLIIHKLYDKEIGTKLELSTPQTTVKLFPGEGAKLTLNLQNRSVFPIINGEFQFQTGPAIKAYEHVEDTEDNWNQIKIPLSIFRKRKTIIELPVLAEQRGVSKVYNITFIIPHLFDFDQLTLKYNSNYQTEFVVFPKLLRVQNVETVFHMIPGEGRSNISPFEDVQSQLGTRDYSYSDPFHRINWNASVKSQSLQTNVYEKVVDMAYVFIINLGTTSDLNMVRFNNNLENLLSYTAYLCEHASRKGVPYEIFINSRKPGKVPYVHLHEGEGKNQYARALEMLARIHKQSMIMPINKMLHRLGKYFYKPKTIIFIGEIPQGAMQTMDSWKMVQKSVFHVKQEEDGAIIKPLEKDGITNAK
ncbi:hypothetical protein CIL05_15255 [Virgibacillus profundi]|uniref:Uncharacterized protein n=1 Tax=Virgibacillus profundi TaxID=2024555 RepID=A0A2A2IA96_9BACI|nr:DUF58 domain-containing protein [Virgibacillus profundi]PAV28649.1 hypothetical protein CIL05_15255 [Virgibacillus profundi]PXY52817.1 DUF58 domain-containing protein [Virgibacillus profundi]